MRKQFHSFCKCLVALIFLASFVSPHIVFAVSDTYINVQGVGASEPGEAVLSVSPAQQTVLEGATFDVSIFLNTKGNVVNTVELDVTFSADKLSIVKPSGDKSLISVWLEPPTFSNANGTTRLVGLIPNGINTTNGLLTTITFKAKATGNATVAVANTSQILKNDGLGTPMNVNYGRGNFTIAPVPPGGVQTFSETHPYQDTWYNNNNPIFIWETTSDVTGFSYLLDNKPFTIPDNISDSTDSIMNYENIGDGVWYFHVKSLRKGIWGQTTHFAVHIDTSPPASFKPQIDFLVSKGVTRLLVSFFTTDELSGLDHYEVGIIQKGNSKSGSPVFVSSESPLEFETPVSGHLRIIVRAYDRAGNVHDESVDTTTSAFIPFLKNNLTAILLLIVLAFIIGIITHYFLGHHILRKIKEIRRILKSEQKTDV